MGNKSEWCKLKDLRNKSLYGAIFVRNMVWHAYKIWIWIKRHDHKIQELTLKMT